MVTELYEIDDLLVNNCISTDVTFEILDSSGTKIMTLENENIVSESLEIKQSICDDEELTIGGCIPSQLKLNLMNVSEDLSGKLIVARVSETYSSGILYPSQNLLPSEELTPTFSKNETKKYTLFVGQIFSCKRTTNRKIRELVAFDRTYYASTVLCKNKLYNYLLSHNDDSQELKFSDIGIWFFDIAKISCPIISNFVNWETKFDLGCGAVKDVLDKNFTALEGIKYLCELNGIFLIDDRMSNKNTVESVSFRVVKPYKNVDNKYDISSYSDLSFDDFETKQIMRYQFYYDKDGSLVSHYNNGYENYSQYISNNKLTQCLSTSNDLRLLTINLENRGKETVERIIGDVYVYRPFTASIFNRWWVQVGDRVRLPTNDEEVPFVESIVFSKTIKGINGMIVEIEAKGVEVLGKESDDNINE
jgi:hypothetical protein